MAAAGCRLIANPVGRSAMLVGAVFSQARYWYKLLKLIKREFSGQKPAVVIPIDSSAVNLRVAGIAKQAGIPVCYYVAPQLWASRPWRITKLKAVTDTVCCVLPFEEAYFRKGGVHAVYVGHPMFDTPAHTPETDPASVEPLLPDISIEQHRGFVAAHKNHILYPCDNPWQEIREFSGTARTAPPGMSNPTTLPSNPRVGSHGGGGPRVAIFPGSRKGEIDANLPPMLEIISEIKGRFPRVSFVAAAPSEERAWQIRKFLRKGNTPVEIRVGMTDAIIRWSDLVLTKSGTATLQVARHHKPMIVMYAVAAWKWHLVGRHIINTKYISLVNILADRELVPEYVPFYGSPLPVAHEAIELLDRVELRANMSRDLAALVQPLEPIHDAAGHIRKAAERVAEEVTKLLPPHENVKMGMAK